MTVDILKFYSVLEYPVLLDVKGTFSIDIMHMHRNTYVYTNAHMCAYTYTHEYKTKNHILC